MFLLYALGMLLALASATCTALGGGERETPFEAFEYSAPTGVVAAVRAGSPDAPRIVYVHGTPGDAGAFDAYLADPLEGFESIAIDRPGCGASEPRRHVSSLRLQAAALEPLLVARRDTGSVLVGHSLGAAVVLRAALDFPDRVRAVVLLAGAVDPGLEELRWYNYAALPLEPLLSRSLRNSNREIRAFERELSELAGSLASVTTPVLVMHGTEDSLVPFANVDFVREQVDAPVEVVALDGADHFFIWSDRAGVCGALIGFLRDLDEAPVHRGPR